MDRRRWRRRAARPWNRIYNFARGALPLRGRFWRSSRISSLIFFAVVIRPGGRPSQRRPLVQPGVDVRLPEADQALELDVGMYPMCTQYRIVDSFTFKYAASSGVFQRIACGRANTFPNNLPVGGLSSLNTSLSGGSKVSMVYLAFSLWFLYPFAPSSLCCPARQASNLHKISMVPGYLIWSIHEVSWFKIGDQVRGVTSQRIDRGDPCLLRS